MAKFKVEVDLDWMDSETTIDDEIKEEVIRGARDYLLEKTTNEIQKKLDDEIGKKLLEAGEKVDEIVDGFLKAITTDNISKLKVAEKKSSWSSEVKMLPISEYIGERFEAFCNKKIYDKDFRITRYEGDAKYSMAQASILQYMQKTLGGKVEEIVKNAQKNAEQEIVKTLEQTLMQNLAEETVKKMNIPQVLQNLQARYAEIENQGERIK